MEVTYKLESDDLATFARDREKSKVAPVFRPYLLPLLATAIVLFKFLRTWANYGFNAAYLNGLTLWSLFLNWGRTMLIVMAANLFIYIILHPSATSWLIKSVLQFLGLSQIETMIVRLQPQGVFISGKDDETLLYWSKFLNIANDENQIVFITGDKGDGLIVPKRAFANNAAANEFFNCAVTLWKAAGGTLPVTPPIPTPH